MRNLQWMIFSSKSVLRNERYVDVIHVTVFKNVAFKIASEASYVYILSGQKFIKNAKKVWRVFQKLKLAVKQCYQASQF